jgi:L-fucose isomerase-like protein
MIANNQTKVGLVSIGVPWFDATVAKTHLSNTQDYLSKFWNLAGPLEVITGNEKLEETIQFFKIENPVDVLILQIGTFPEGEDPLHLAEQLNIPIILHALPEPDLEKSIALNSLCGVNMTTYAFNALDIPHTFVIGDILEKTVQEEMEAQIRAALALAELKRTRLALVGFRAPGFYPCVFDELLLRKKLGVKLDHINLGAIMTELNTGDRKALPVSLFPTIEGGQLPPEAVVMFEKYYAALTKVLDLDVHRLYAIKDWPEIMGLEYPGGIWPVLGWMADDGRLLAPEGDVNAAVTVALLNFITGKIPFFADIVTWNDSNSSFLLWHYGAAPSLAADKKDILYGNEGREVQFTIKPGRATLARLGLYKGSFRLMTISCEVLDTPVTLRRASAWVQTINNPAGEIMRSILENGWEHHFILVHGNVQREFEIISRLTGIPITNL